MGNSDEIEDATISIDEATILEIKATIAFPFLLSLTTIALQGRQRNLQKVCCTFRVFFRLFFVSIVVVFAQTELASNIIPRKACYSRYATILP